jgi:protein-S-isoprenylcysteine O-methyltransferase Ste14
MRRVFLVLVIVLAAAAAYAVIQWATPLQAFVAGGLLAAPGVPLMILSRLQLGKAFSVAPKATTLVTHGVYSKVPHPLYVFLDISLLGLVIAFRRQWLLGVWLALVAAHSWAARREARVLGEAFGDAYREYRAKAWW